ncbi:response regulator [Oceanobacter mangrovi]|uniref:response regulator n=1 Tax=Oceanobacter mangrovi TaxID=2862510 RepID=UPI001C8D4AF8|nr:response regulator [Oceanobacter mangrovi]
MRLLLVEDDLMLGSGLQAALERECHVVDWLKDGMQVLAMLQQGEYELLILDIGLPGKDGIRCLREIRQQRLDVPVLLLTARDGIDDRVAGLDAGADDYLLKPFDFDELCARIRALGRRQGQLRCEIGIDGLKLDQRSHRVTLHGMPVELSRRELMLLETLLHKPEQVFTRRQLEETLYNWDEELGSNAIEVHVHHLRKKLGTGVITTVRGLGYRLGSVA